MSCLRPSSLWRIWTIAITSSVTYSPCRSTTFAQRLQVSKLLYEEHTYEMVRKQFPVSNATITRVSTALHYGKGGYRKVLEGMRQREAAEEA